MARVAMRRLRLHQVWLLVSPGNPMKAASGMAPLAQRLAGARRLGDGRRVVATAIECRLRTRYTHDTLRALRRLFPRVCFVWIMGADNLTQLPQWQHWTGIVRTMPFAVMPRPSYNGRALAGQAAQRLRRSLHRARSAPVLAGMRPPAWTFLPAKQNQASATALRKARDAAPAWPLAVEAFPDVWLSRTAARCPPAYEGARP